MLVGDWGYKIMYMVFILGGIIQHHCTDSVINHAVIIEGFDMSGMYCILSVHYLVFQKRHSLG